MNDAALVWKVAAALYEQQEPLEAMDTSFDALDDADKTVWWHDANAALQPVRDWLALPPSEEEIEAAAKAMARSDGYRWHDDDVSVGPLANGMQWKASAKAALVASRAVLVPPPTLTLDQDQSATFTAVPPPEETT